MGGEPSLLRGDSYGLQADGSRDTDATVTTSAVLDFLLRRTTSHRSGLSLGSLVSGLECPSDSHSGPGVEDGTTPRRPPEPSHLHSLYGTRRTPPRSVLDLSRDPRRVPQGCPRRQGVTL